MLRLSKHVGGAMRDINLRLLVALFYPLCLVPRHLPLISGGDWLHGKNTQQSRRRVISVFDIVKYHVYSNKILMYDFI
jgi:hypothetical protein